MRLLPLLFTAGIFAVLADKERIRPSHGHLMQSWWHTLNSRIGHYGERIIKTTTRAPAAKAIPLLANPVNDDVFIPPEKLTTFRKYTTLASTTTPEPTTTTDSEDLTTIPPKPIIQYDAPTTQEIETEPPTTTPAEEPVETTTTEKLNPPFLGHSVQASRMGSSCPFYWDTTIASVVHPIFWPETKVGEIAFPTQPCFTSDFLPVARECQLIDGIARWAEKNGTCDPNAVSNTTFLLYEFTKKDAVSSETVVKVTRNMATILSSVAVPSASDVMVVDNVLVEITKHAQHLREDSLNDVASVLDKVSVSSQVTINLQIATNSILRSVDTILAKVQLDQSGIARAHSNATSLMAADLSLSGVKGVQISDSKIVPLTAESGAVTSASFLQISSGRAAFVLLGNEDNLFKAKNENLTLNSKVLGVSLDGQHPWHQLKEPVIRLKFKPTNPSEGMLVKCAYWDIYNSDWKTDGCTFVGKEGDLDVCECNHLTHFGEIIGVSGDDKILDIISIVGCSLSLFGLLGIAATAAMFEHWRSRLGNKILLHLSASIGLTMAVFLSIALDAGAASDASCITLGVLLHYSILASFCWMLISALLQFLRFVSVLSARPPHFLLKGVLFGWVLPTVPVIVLLSIGPAKSYPRTNSSSNFCYPVELSLILGVIIPVACAVIGNLLVFCLIVYRVSCGRPKNLTISTMAERRVIALRQLRMSVLLFFLLGLTWIFGLLAMVAPFLAPWRVAFSYLFCTTATLQGLALFIFFIVWEKKTRQMWLTALPERFAPTRPSRPTTSSTAFSESNSHSSSRVRDERAPLRQKTSTQNLTGSTNRNVSGQ
ncbi:Hypothetical predicted protein [Cloeon dipterum]|uniref:G-protein coupled receptors family 2 profile 2 domain-containing protein n=1 Tax=Cloeon dipterum TaxID=197152 RepID=A0A8S1D187_9INSE|nr:Hypothetical predicted protein [Cloeon dipterum]